VLSSKKAADSMRRTLRRKIIEGISCLHLAKRPVKAELKIMAEAFRISYTPHPHDSSIHRDHLVAVLGELSMCPTPTKQRRWILEPQH
jgi:hypothetical protein